MERDREYLERWKLEYIRKEPSNYLQNLEIFESLWEEARAFGVVPLKDPLEGIEIKIFLAKALNVQRPH
jgi:hypothetical protein